MQRAVVMLTLWLLAAGSARADDTLGERVDRATDALAETAEDVKESAGELASAASDKTREVAGAAAETVTAGARSLSASAASLWTRLGSGARAHASKAGSEVGQVVERGKSAASDALAALRAETRGLLLGAADALDRETSETRQRARRVRWDKLKARFGLEERPSEALSEELRDHEYRVARLKRVRALAHEADDEAAVARSDKLLEAEHGRHKRRIEELRRQGREEARR